MIEYFKYWIYAPCWESWRILGGDGQPDEEYKEALAGLRRQADELETVEGVAKWIRACLEYALDPL